MERYDAIVIGVGGVGSAVLYHLARRGVRVLGVDRFPPGHDRGSSHGETRIIRQAYFEHPDYVPLLRQAYELWDELSRERGHTLRHATGLLEVGPADGSVVRGVLASAAIHGLEVDELSRADVATRFPGFALPDGFTAVLERAGGYLEVEECVLAHTEAAARLGARALSGIGVERWRADGAGFVVETDRGNFGADCLVVTAGAWASELLSDLGIAFEVRRKPLFWFENHQPGFRADRGCPAFLFDLPSGVFYGFPDLGTDAVKVAEHTSGEVVGDPLTVDRTMRAGERERLEEFLSSHLPGVGHHVVRHEVCLYTMAPDENFVVDVHPDHPRLAFAAGLSGHGFKFAAALGKALAELALDGSTTSPIGFLNCRRPALRPTPRTA